MPAPTEPYQPYADVHQDPAGPGDARPTALQIVEDCGAVGKLKGKTVLITGASSGIGVEAARALYSAGASLFLTARDLPKLEAVIADIVASSPAEVAPRPQAVEMRLDSLASVRAAATRFQELSNGQLNKLINNAGVMATPYGLTEDGFETQIGICHMAHFLLFELLKPSLIQSAKASGTTSRVVNVSSAGHRIAPPNFDSLNFTEATYNPYAAYGAAKTANIWMTNAITRYYGAQGVTGLAVHPGGIPTTGLWKTLTVEELTAMGDAEAMAKGFKSPMQGAATTVWAAVSPHFEDVGNGGRFLGDVGECRAAKDADAADYASYAPWAYDVASEDRLWKVSREMVGFGPEV